MTSFQKHIINNPNETVRESLRGLAYTNPSVKLLDEPKIIISTPIPPQVHLISGGGSGHEPAHASYVGKGILSAAVVGEVFASPSSGQVRDALEELRKGEDDRGVVMIVKNYTGDVLHFGLARERYAALHPDEDKVRIVIVGDDVAVGKKQGGMVGRRGLAGTVLTYKISGALASRGASLDEVHVLAQFIADNVGTIGVGLGHTHVPGTETDAEKEKEKGKEKGKGGKGKKEEGGEGEEDLGGDQVEIGMGIHNEPGHSRIQLSSASSLIDNLLSTLTSSTDEDRSFLPFKHDQKDEVVLMVNNLGGVSELELGLVAKEAGEWLNRKGFTVKRVLAGTYMTSLNMPGISLTLLLLPRTPTSPSPQKPGIKFDAETILDLLDSPSEAPGWKPATTPNVKALERKSEDEVKEEEKRRKEEMGAGVGKSEGKGPDPTDPKLFVEAIKAACKNVIKAEPEITKYDTVAGDGDCGLTLKAGAEGVLSKVQSSDFPSDDVAAAFLVLSEVLEEKMGGTSGALYSIFFNGLSKGLQEAKERKAKDQDGGEQAVKADPKMWADALDFALNTLFRYTRARPPSRTLVDPLSAFVTTLSFGPEDLADAFQQAQEAAEATAHLEAKAGRAAYVERERVKEAHVPDAGAWGVFKLLEGVKGVVAGAAGTEAEKK